MAHRAFTQWNEPHGHSLAGQSSPWVNLIPMETSRLTAFVTWQRSVQLAAEILKLAQAAQGRPQRCLDDLAEEAIQRAASLGDSYLNLETGFELWSLNDGRALALYTRLKTAEIAGLLPERDIRRLLGMFEEVERMMENYLRAQAKAEEARKTVPQARSRWQPHAQDGFKPLSESKVPRPRRET